VGIKGEGRAIYLILQRLSNPLEFSELLFIRPSPVHGLVVFLNFGQHLTTVSLFLNKILLLYGRLL
jgi:hypothetical protein